MTKLGPDKPWLVLDGAHTPASAAALAKTLQQTFRDLPLGLIVAMADDKDHPGAIHENQGSHLIVLQRCTPLEVPFCLTQNQCVEARSVSILRDAG